MNLVCSIFIQSYDSIFAINMIFVKLKLALEQYNWEIIDVILTDLEMFMNWVKFIYAIFLAF
jgi:hypothetical protein